jgi:hypothetical protein
VCSALVGIAEIDGALNSHAQLAEFGPECLPGDTEDPGGLPSIPLRVLQHERQDDFFHPLLRFLEQTGGSGREPISDESFQFQVMVARGQTTA